MSKTRLIMWVGIPLAVLAAGALALLLIPLLFPENVNVTRANFDRVTIGMTEAEVEGILGNGQEITKEESGKYSASFLTFLGEPPVHNRILLWQRGMRNIVMYFQDGKVVAMRTSLKAGE
jgi:hypothetical protein